ncbi:hypothetical protein [Cardinium endosymbiont of Philonthus spinipes]|uniref:hypothetical protein n=1 Tax=Cardinium endosymbiont of Philonthus spinipes TaxID=3077941 RepID=UPI00313A8283
MLLLSMELLLSFLSWADKHLTIASRMHNIVHGLDQMGKSTIDYKHGLMGYFLSRDNVNLKRIIS